MLPDVLGIFRWVEHHFHVPYCIYNKLGSPASRTCSVEKSQSGSLSKELEDDLKNLNADVTRAGTLAVVPILTRMNLCIFVTNDEAGFITSDAPCVKCIPYSMEIPSLGHPEIEITLPLSPAHLAVFSWKLSTSLYFETDLDTVNEANSRTFFACEQEFISWKGLLREDWFLVKTPS
jgi:hypothetical protein